MPIFFRSAKLQRIPPDEAVEWASRFVKEIGKDDRQEEMGALLGLWKTWYRDLLLLKAKGSEDSLINMDLSHELKIAAEAFRMENLVSSLLALDQAERDLLRFRNPGARPGEHGVAVETKRLKRRSVS